MAKAKVNLRQSRTANLVGGQKMNRKRAEHILRQRFGPQFAMIVRAKGLFKRTVEANRERFYEGEKLENPYNVADNPCRWACVEYANADIAYHGGKVRFSR